MLTLDSILKTTRQMTAYGEQGTAGALDHLPQKVQGRSEKRKASHASASEGGDTCEHRVTRRWDEKTRTYVHIS